MALDQQNILVHGPLLMQTSRHYALLSNLFLILRMGVVSVLQPRLRRWLEGRDTSAGHCRFCECAKDLVPPQKKRFPGTCSRRLWMTMPMRLDACKAVRSRNQTGFPTARIAVRFWGGIELGKEASWPLPRHVKHGLFHRGQVGSFVPGRDRECHPQETPICRQTIVRCQGASLRDASAEPSESVIDPRRLGYLLASARRCHP